MRQPEDTPDLIDLVQELRRTVGLFDGAMTTTPKKAWKEAIDLVKLHAEGFNSVGAGENNLALRSDPIWEKAHRLREAIYNSFETWNVRWMSQVFNLVQDDGVVQAWVRAAIGEEPDR